MPHPDDPLDSWHLSEPFWKSNRVYGESLLFLQANPQTPACARLLFAARQIQVLRSASHLVTFREGQDYTLDPRSQRICLTPGSTIPFIRQADLYRTPGQEHAIQHKRGDENTWLYFGEGHYFHDLQVEVTYPHADTWGGFTPQWAGDKLTRTLGKLRARQPVTVCLSGDSISAGANASQLTGVEPYQPSYGPLITAELARRFGSRVAFHNFAVGGEGSAHALRVAPQVAAEKPDLVIIAYGMNNVSQRDPQGFAQPIAASMQAIRRENPQTEFILVASMLGNPEWAFTPLEMFPSYREALSQLCGDGVVLADMTQMWTDLLKIKHLFDLTGNGVNHPNDFGHRIYAQVLLSLLVDQPVETA